jgi:hypothetical protein
MRRGDLSNSSRLDFSLRLDEFGTGWRARKPFASSRWPCCESWWADEWQRGRRSPAGRRVSRPPGPVAPLQLRPPVSSNRRIAGSPSSCVCESRLFDQSNRVCQLLGEAAGAVSTARA